VSTATGARGWRTRGDTRMSLAGHLRELRKRLIISAIAILVAAVVGFFLAPIVIDALRIPINQIAQDRNATIVYTTVTGAFDLRIAIAVTIAIVIASPIWLFQIFAFMVPGLTGKEKKYIFGFFFSAVPLFFLGAASGWYVFPHMVQLLTSFSSSQEATYLDARTYYDFVIKLVLAVGIAFVMPVFLVLLNFVGVLSAKAIISGWRIAILLIFLFTAIATPAADIISMFLLAIPMIVLYFIAWIVAVFHDRAAARRADELAASVPVE
jgi:sec-independent protein translocase protein TatC